MSLKSGWLALALALAAAPLFGGELRVFPREATDTPKYDGTWFQPCQVLLVGDIAMEP